MKENLMQKTLHIEGMTCTSCEMRIENALMKLDGVIEVKAIYRRSNVYVTYDSNKLDIERIIDVIDKLDYTVKNNASYGTGTEKRAKDGRTLSAPKENKMGPGQIIGIGVIVLTLYLIINNTIGFNFIPEVNQSMGYGILFVVGLLTSLHCIAMCGGINLSVCVQYKIGSNEYNKNGEGTSKGNGTAKFSKLKPSALYNLGRIISYTVIGGLVGAFGSVVSFSGTAKGIIAIVSGIFMVIMGLNMLNIFPWLRKINPRMPKIFGKRIYGNVSQKGPLVIGLLNGLMPCGPLQAMQLYALGTGSMLAGAVSMFLFSVGTVPLMFGFGAISSLLSGKFTHKMLKVSAVLIMMLGVVMLNRGLNLSGYNIGLALGASSGNENIAKLENGQQVVTINLEPGSYAPIVVQKDIPVKWIIKADEESLNGCNNAITAREFGIENEKLTYGDNIIEFTPKKEGTFIYTCWMGMISGYVKVVDDVNNLNPDDIEDEGWDYIPESGSGRDGCCG